MSTETRDLIAALNGVLKLLRSRDRDICTNCGNLGDQPHYDNCPVSRAEVAIANAEKANA